MTQHTDDLKQQVERILYWEHSSHWRLCDYEHLSERMYEYTHQRINAQDLQAFWKEPSLASLVLLNTLARFVDYSDWKEFCIRNSYGSVEADEETGQLHAPMWEIPVRWVVVICWLSVIASVAVGVLLVCKQ